MPRPVALLCLGVLASCSSTIVDPPAASRGDHEGTGGANGAAGGASHGGSFGVAGTAATVAGASASLGGAASGGSGTGGAMNGGAPSGGTATGGSGTGGKAAGGTSSGGAAVGGTANGGSGNGGSVGKGGAPSGGSTASGGATTSMGGSATGDDGCQGGPALNVTLSQIAVYQTVKVPLMQSGMEVAAASRKADVVAGKDAVFRLFVTVGSGFTARSLSGRVFVDNGGSVDMYYAKVNVSATSAEATLASTFQVTVPKEKISRTTQYYAELVECGTGSGSAQSPRFPATGSIALGARETGTLKIKVIPISANSMTPDTSATPLNLYKAQFMAMYPITSIDISVGDVVTVADAKDWTAMLDTIRAKRQTDQPAADVYYYGLLKPTSTLQQYCGSGCTAGIGYVVSGNSSQAASQRAALGLAYGDNTSAQTMAHEVGHNHGRNHAPCVQGGTISGVDANYPNSNGQIGVYGWDSRTSALIAPDRTDIMGYCNNKWISDYTYDGITTRVATVNGAPMNISVPSELIHPWRVLLLDASGPRWGAPIAVAQAPAGQAELADVLDATGARITTVQVFRTEISDIGAFSFEVPPPEPGWAKVQVNGAAPIAYAH